MKKLYKFLLNIIDMLQWFDTAMTDVEDRQLPGCRDTQPTGEDTCLEAVLAREYGGINI